MGYEDLSVVSLSYLGQVLEPRWDPHRNRSRSLRDPSVRGAVLRRWSRRADGPRLVHDGRRALVVARVEAHWRGLTGVSVPALRSWIRGHGVAAGLRHRETKANVKPECGQEGGPLVALGGLPGTDMASSWMKAFVGTEYQEVVAPSQDL
ncbi:hypothetical protein EYF80_021875 [Liparis tanakae]|uniref:Uncharacterized protein n=1 Tax=Liparis tanakae TaxID=230148 RepID=A0A4Z2HPY9_9TELE|nr:hypothetical protein EYF80_021875 [Liparis tanakae]